MAPSARKHLPPGVKPKSLVSKSKPHNITFKDHTGSPAIMSWSCSENRPNLPFLPSWVFYMVHPEIPRDFDGCAFESGIERDRIVYGGGSFRYEFFFLPGATAEECVAHYRGEMAARGTIWSQIRKVKTAMKEKKKQEESEEGADDSVEEPSSGDGDEPRDGTAGEGLPGLAWPKWDQDCYFINYRSWLFMYLDADIQWGPNQDHDVCLVKFDPIPIEWEEGEKVRWDPMKHPVHSQRMKARGRVGYEEELISWMGNRTNSQWVLAADDATCDAEELGWESW
ncbi:hypothetical protein EDB81DRAFT_95933 [Dactylonectria macrodidyma]|uniref:Uncharacterized protein n=1 Tax=Dactylonectria macrodidyma TaxID=307937 RepID=A0A9P9E9I6_9HYPO|nr:hypothetical protein EDB81DRAFT_95933 [Dactylonectria macrodidyma]